MWIMMAAITMAFTFWAWVNPVRLVPALAVLLAVLLVFALSHQALVHLVAATGWPINFWAAIPVTVLLIWSIIGFWPYLQPFHILTVREALHAVSDPSKTVPLAFMLGDFIGIVRMARWDIAEPVLRAIEGRAMIMSDPGDVVFNFGIATLYALYCALNLSTLYHMIPVDRRAGYNWLLAPLYPRRPFFIRFFAGR